MLKKIKKNLKFLSHSRSGVVMTAFVLMFLIVTVRIFTLQVLDGSSYQEDFSDAIHKTISLAATRGNIYDCNGKLLAYNELSYSLTIADTGSYDSTTEKNKLLNAELAEILSVIDKNGETLYNTFGISRSKTGKYSFNVSGTALHRFLADVFGAQSYSDLEYNEKLKIDEANASPTDVMNYLFSDEKYGVASTYSDEVAYEIVVIRYAVSANLYARYKTTTIATDIGEKTIAYMSEHSDTLTGVQVEETTTRKYNSSECMSSIIGYTGQISAEEYETLSEEDDSYTTTDIVGKSGLEQYYESTLKGTKGEKEVYINNVGKITEVISTTESKPGNDLYISIDSELQEAVYDLLEQEIAGVVYSNIVNDEITIDEVYFALIDNNVIDIDDFSEKGASSTEKSVYKSFQSAQSSVLSSIKAELESGATTVGEMDEQTESYFTYMISMLKSQDLLVSSRIDTSDSTYNQWISGKLSPRTYLNYCIKQQWIDSTLLNSGDKYSDRAEIYEALCDFILDQLSDDSEFSKLVYQSMIENGMVSGQELCLILYDQGALKKDKDTYAQLEAGSLSAYDFILDKINNLEITPAQLALDPCTGSCVMSDPNTGEIKALVSYPGFDGNKLANTVDAEYYASLQSDKSNPQWNYATQEETAPGSTFKMVTSVAGLAEGIIDINTKIKCTGKFTEVDNEPECWIYASGETHGDETVSDALRDSCNVYYYTVGYELAQLDNDGVYSDPVGISYLQKYASMFGLDRKTGIEISESTPQLATEYPVMAAIGQSNNNLTTVSLSRYVTAVTSGKVYEYSLMSKIVDQAGTVLDQYIPEYEDISSILPQTDWDAIHEGMRMVVTNLDTFDGCKLTIAGKTGTAQQIETRPNHALFVGYCPYENPQITIAIRITYGSSSHNAAAAARNILSYYFGESKLDELLATKAAGVNGTSSNSVTD